MRAFLISAVGLSALALANGCAPEPPVRPETDVIGVSAAPSNRDDASAAPSSPTSVMPPPPTTPALPHGALGPLTVEEARVYMLQLINKDRAKEGLTAVELDEGPPTTSAQTHADDMAALGFLGHWGSDGSVPESRLTAAGGADMVLENALCFVDEHARTLDPAPTIQAREVERAESMFFNEKPPNDGHRRNILKPYHRKVGIGVSQPSGTANEIAVPCFTQEFTDAYGVYAKIPGEAHVGDVIHVAGTVAAPAKPAGVGLARVDTPRPLAVDELNRRRSYPVPAPYVMYWPKGYKTLLPLTINGARFSIDVPLNDGGKPGLYEVSVWAKVPNVADLVMVGLRTVNVK